MLIREQFTSNVYIYEQHKLDDSPPAADNIPVRPSIDFELDLLPLAPNGDSATSANLLYIFKIEKIRRKPNKISPGNDKN